MERIRTVFEISPQGVAEGLPKSFLGTPFIIDEDGKPHERLIDYLWARRNGDWAAEAHVQGRHLEANGRQVLTASNTYLRNRAYQLDVFRRWLRRDALDFREVSESVLERFAEDLEEGVETAFEGGLAPQTVNQYLTSAIDFLQYGYQRGWRSELSLKATKVRAAGRGRSTTRLLVMRRVHPAELTDWYSEQQISEFLGEFETAAAALAALIMHRMGLRLFEVLSLKLESFPTLEEYRRDPAKRRIGIQGKFRKRRKVPLDEAVVKAVGKFKSVDRKLYEKRLVEPTDLLLISDSVKRRVNGSVVSTTAPLKPRQLQKEFAKARNAAGFSALSPHLLRHHFAAHYLLRAWRRKAAYGGLNEAVFDIGTVSSLLATELLELRNALGHTSLDTTMGYLYGVAYLLGSDIPELYSTELDGVPA